MSEFKALEHWKSCHNDKNNADVSQEADQKVVSKQQSYEWIIVKDSECVKVHTTDTQAAVSLQLGIQAAIAAVISITIGDSNQGNAIAQEMKQFIRTKQRNVQKTIIENSKGINVTTTDTDIAVNIQAMLQILVAIVAKLDVL